MEKIYTSELHKPELNEETLEHYGVLGMKWGVRKDAARAYGRATAKLNRLKKKSQVTTQKKVARYTKKAAKANKKVYKAQKAYNKALNSKFTSKDKLNEAFVKKEKLQAQASKKQYKADQKIKKAANASKRTGKWERQMNKAFKGMDTNKLLQQYAQQQANKKKKTADSNKNGSSASKWDQMTPAQQRAQLKKDLAAESKHYAKREAEFAKKYSPGSNPYYQKKKKR